MVSKGALGEEGMCGSDFYFDGNWKVLFFPPISLYVLFSIKCYWASDGLSAVLQK